MKIVIFSTAYLPFIGGAEVAVEEITNRLPEFQFDMITAKMKKELPYFQRVRNINVYRVGFGAPLDKFIFAILGW